MEKVTYKATLRIPTKEQYSYIEIAIEGTVEEIVSAYLRFTDTYWAKREQWEKDKPPFN